MKSECKTDEKRINSFQQREVDSESEEDDEYGNGKKKKRKNKRGPPSAYMIKKRQRLNGSSGGGGLSTRDYEIARTGRDGKATPNYNEATMDFDLSETDQEGVGSVQPEGDGRFFFCAIQVNETQANASFFYYSDSDAIDSVQNHRRAAENGSFLHDNLIFWIGY
jgi:hypothetical protein